MAALEDILQRHPVWRGAAPARHPAALASGYAPLDGELPGGGWPTGGLTEILGSREGIGELTLVLPALARLSALGKRLVWIAPPHLPYAPALAAAGVDLAHLAVVRAPGRRDALWAAEQALHAGSCHALVAWFRNARYAELRRLAVAAEASGAFVAVFRPRAAMHETSPACLRLVLEPVAGELDVHFLKRRGAPLAAPLRLAVKSPLHALGRAPLSLPLVCNPRADRRLGVPVHA
jgi:hypothetical protein